MDKHNLQANGFRKLVSQLKELVLATIGFSIAIVCFIDLAQGHTGLISIVEIVLGNTELVSIVTITLGLALLWLACLYFARFWKPEANDGVPPLILPIPNDKPVQQQEKKERRRRRIRIAALFGLILMPLLLSITAYGTWKHVPTLHNDDVVILVAEFDGPDTQNNRITETILRQLREATDGYEDVKIVAFKQAVTEESGGSDEARKIAENRKADIMIWGWYGQSDDVIPISANFEIMEINEHTSDDLGESASGAIQTLEIAELNSFELQTKLSKDMSFLTLFTLGMANYADDNWIDAITLFDDALNHTNKALGNLNLNPLYFYKGNSQFYNEELELAINAFDLTLDTKTDLHQAFYNKGVALAALERHNEAISAFDLALKIKPDLHQSLNSKGIALRNLERYNDAISAFDLALNIKPDDHAALNNKGVVLDGLERYNEAINAYDQALKIKPDDHEVLNNKGLALAALEQYDEAINAHNQALNVKPNYYLALSAKGDALAELGQLDDAIDAYNQALTIQPEDLDALNNQGVALYELGKLDEAIDAFDQALTIQPDDQLVLYNKAGAHSLKNDTNNALQFLQKAIALNENYRNSAKVDATFDNIRQNPQFQRLINAD